MRRNWLCASCPTHCDLTPQPLKTTVLKILLKIYGAGPILCCNSNLLATPQRTVLTSGTESRQLG